MRIRLSRKRILALIQVGLLSVALIGCSGKTHAEQIIQEREENATARNDSTPNTQVTVLYAKWGKKIFIGNLDVTYPEPNMIVLTDKETGEVTTMRLSVLDSVLVQEGL